MADGRYTLHDDGDLTHFWRLFGDFQGTAAVNNVDAKDFLLADLDPSNPAYAAYLTAFNYTGHAGRLTFNDLIQFILRYGTHV